MSVRELQTPAAPIAGWVLNSHCVIRFLLSFKPFCQLRAYVHLKPCVLKSKQLKGTGREGQGERRATGFLVTVSKIHICTRKSHFRSSLSKTTTAADRQEVQFQVTIRHKIGQINYCSLKGVGVCALTNVTEITNGLPLGDPMSRLAAPVLISVTP